MERLAILTSGGDAPGMNAAIRAATVLGLHSGLEVLGIRNGYRGLLDETFFPLGPDRVGDILRDGGTILGSARCPEFHDPDTRQRAREILVGRGVDGLIVIGGNGSLTGATALSEPPIEDAPRPNVVGIPASIDNDIAWTGMAIGVDTAMNTITDACDRLADTAAAHDRVFILEVMGRDCGYLAMTGAIAGGADGLLHPEADETEEAMLERLVKTIAAIENRPEGRRRALIVKAEGVRISTEKLKRRLDEALVETLGEDAPETRITVLGHLVRGGRPTAFDRLLAGRLARVAVEALLRGTDRKMAAWMPPVPIPEGRGDRAEADPYCWLVDLAGAMEETNRLMAGEGPLARWRAHVFDDLEEIWSL